MSFFERKSKAIFILIGMAITIELLVLTVDFFVPSHFSLFSSHDNLTIQFTGTDSKWYFLYPGSDGLLNTKDDIEISGTEDLVLPENNEITIKMISKDYLYCLDIPELGKSQLAIPDIDYTMVFSTPNIDLLSLVPGAVCGRLNQDLYRKIHIVSTDNFQNWMSEQYERASLILK